MQLRRAILALATASLVAGCAALKPPVRPDYTGADTINSAQPAQLVGTWVVRELNPYPDSEPQTTIIEYRDDGTVQGRITPSGAGVQALGNLEFELNGNWALQGDIISHQNITMQSTNDNSVGNLISGFINDNQRGLVGQANIYELSADRIVMLGTDGAAMEYIRQR